MGRSGRRGAGGRDGAEGVAGAPSESPLHLIAALRGQVLISGAFSFAFFILAVGWPKSRTLSWLTALNCSYTFALAFAHRAAQRGHTLGAATAHAYATLGLGLGMATLVPNGWPVVLFAPIMAVAGALPYLHDTRLLRLLVASVVFAMAIGGVGMFFPSRDDVPTGVKLGIMWLAIGTSTAIVMHLLWQFSSRLRLNLQFAEAAQRSAEHAAAELRQVAQLREDFLTVTSHELKTPVTAILLQMQVLRRTASAADPGLFLERLRRCEETVKRLARLVDGVLDAAPLAEDFVPQRERIDLVALIRGICEQTRPVAGEQGLQNHAAAEPIFGCWDKRGLERVVVSLIENAIKYGAGKPIEVNVRRIDPTAAEINVRDRGIGVSAADRQRIFAKFERAASVSNYGGLGLGLWLSRRIVEAHGGSIDVAPNADGPGSNFVVRLPLAPSEVERAPEPHEVRSTRAPARAPESAECPRHDSGATL